LVLDRDFLQAGDVTDSDQVLLSPHGRATTFKRIARAADRARGVAYMALVPSMKGRAFGFVVEALVKCVSAGQTSRGEIARRLQPYDLTILDQPLDDFKWYEIRLYAKLAELLRDVGGGDDRLRRLGADAAENLLQAGLYQQLEYLNRTQVAKETDSHARFAAFGRDLRPLTTLSAVLLNFTRWESKLDPERAEHYVIEVSEASEYPDVLAIIIEGFMNRMSSQLNEPDLWRWQRVRADLVLYRMTRTL